MMEKRQKHIFHIIRRCVIKRDHDLESAVFHLQEDNAS